MVVRKLNSLSSQSNAMICDMNKKCPEREAVRRQFATRNFNEGKDITVATLQDAFLKFKRNRQKKLQQMALTNERTKRNQRDQGKMEELRLKFVEQAKMYLGVPYARRYHEPGSPEYEAPLFLDCCGLIRKVLRDLKEDFGFTIGPWNQAYMFDTLPINIQDVCEMKPGDLVFVSGVYHKPKMRKQRHNIVHVEIWTGDGEKTVGARYQRGKLQVHDTYQYVSKSYHSMRYHFKSIDTWLNGICKSFCPEHLWKSCTFIPGKRSIFAIQEPDSDEAAEDCNEEENLTNIKVQSHVKRTENSDFLEREDCMRNQSGLKLDCKKDGVQRSRFCELGCKLRESADEWSEDKAEVLKKRNQEETIDNCENFWTESCFCSRCTYEVGDFIFEDDKTQVKLVDSSDEDFGTHSGSLDDDHRQSWDNESDVKQCYFTFKLTTSGLLDYEPISGGRPRVVSSDVLARPNGGETGGETGAKKKLMSTKITRKGRGSTIRKSPNDDEDQPNERWPQRPLSRPNHSLTRLHEKAPTFYIGGHNGVKMIEATLTSLGWKRIHDNSDRTFYLKWVECKKNLDFWSFREGKQLVNHIPNGNLLTTKIGLLTSLQEFERVSNKVQSATNSKSIKMKEFFPETYKLQNQGERDNFIHHIYQDGELWICKPNGMNQGKGIFLIRCRNELKERLGPKDESQVRQKCFPSPGRVIQRYIPNPLLLNGFKADIRTYMLIACTCPYMVFYHPGYVRLSLVPYSLNREEIHAHLTNQYVQKKHPLYEEVKEETVWSLEQLQEYINKTYKGKAIPEDWVFTGFTKRMQEIMLRCFSSVSHKLERKLGYFDLLGFDFMLDENFKVWLIEINVNPALHTNCKILSDVIPELVDRTLKLVIEVFEKTKKKERLTSLENLGQFQLLYCDERK